MSFWAIAFLGSTTIGAPIVGWVGQNIGPRWGLGIGGVAALLAAGLGFLTLRNLPSGRKALASAATQAESRTEPGKPVS